MLPIHTKIGIDLYVNEGYPVGDFLYAVLTNNLFEATGRADHINRPNLADICLYIYNYTPAVCWGSIDKVENWWKLHKENPEEAKKIANRDRESRESPCIPVF
jgi:hypothetical protein